jgi:hypothetical protein
MGAKNFPGEYLWVLGMGILSGGVVALAQASGKGEDLSMSLAILVGGALILIPAVRLKKW